MSYQFSDNWYEQRGGCDVAGEARNTLTNADDHESNYPLRKCPKGWQEYSNSCTQIRRLTRWYYNTYTTTQVSYYRTVAIIMSNKCHRHFCKIQQITHIYLYWPQSAARNLPHFYLAPPLAVMSLDALWHRKARVPGLSYGVVSVILGLAIFVQLRLMTDRETDRQTDGRTDTRWQLIPR